jgi:hypothetical protein
VHPASSGEAADRQLGDEHHEITLMCDDIEATVADLEAKGAVFTRDIRNDGWGMTTSLEIPGAGEMMLYAPRHPPAYDL